MSDHYNGNPHIRKAGENIQLTKWQFDEMVKCKADPIYFAENYIKISHGDLGLITIELYPYQKKIILANQNSRRVVVNTSRQAGKTTTATVIITHFILFNEYKQIGLLANKGDAAREILARIQLAYENLPRWMQAGVEEWNKGSVSLENGCKVIATATSGSAARGKTFSYLYIDETAHVEGWDEFYQSVYPTTSSVKTSKILFTSTPNGLNHFYKTCDGAKKGKNGFVYIEVPWDEVPGRDAAWKADALAAIDHDYEKFAQEFECVDGDTYVDVKIDGVEQTVKIEDLFDMLKFLSTS